MVVTLKDLAKDVPQTYVYNQTDKRGGWFPARPLNWTCRTLRERLREAWMVFTGKADPFVWPEDEPGAIDPSQHPFLSSFRPLAPKFRGYKERKWRG